MIFFEIINRVRKIKFLSEKKADVILLDENLLNISSKKIYFKILRFNEFNISVFLKAVKNLLCSNDKISFKNLYFKNLLEQINPKVIIGHNLNQRVFLAKKMLPSAMTICYQFGFLNKKIIKKIYKKKDLKNVLCDYFLVFHNQDKFLLKKYFKSNFKVVGSVRNNAYIKKKKIKKNYLHYISQYNPKRPRSDKHHLYQSFLLNILKNYCKKKNMNLVISPRSKRVDKPLLNIEEEQAYFFDMIGNNFKFSHMSPYKFSNQCKLNVTLHSNLGFELLGKGEKVFFFQPDKKKYSYPYKLNKHNYHYYNKMNKKVIENKINILINLKNKKWLNYINKIDKIDYDENNKFLMRIIKKKVL